jgi:hypothetical protein
LCARPVSLILPRKSVTIPWPLRSSGRLGRIFIGSLQVAPARDNARASIAVPRSIARYLRPPSASSSGGAADPPVRRAARTVLQLPAGTHLAEATPEGEAAPPVRRFTFIE